MKIQYTERKFAASSLALIERANEIIAEYARDRLILTIRQLYYQFVARDWIPNTQKSYKRLGAIINDARLAGLIDWDAIEDRGRRLERPSVWKGPAQLLEACADQYMINLWAGQKWRPEVWIEKDALSGVAERACEPYRVPYFACRGYVSQSAMWEAGSNRMARYCDEGHEPIIFHLGDHDPSGLDMTRDIEERLAMFHYRPVQVVRLALNADQVREYDPPPNPAKTTDARYAEYRREHGEDSWELDALPPDVLVTLIQDAIEGVREIGKWNKLHAREQRERKTLRRIVERYPEVRRLVNGAPK